MFTYNYIFVALRPFKDEDAAKKSKSDALLLQQSTNTWEPDSSIGDVVLLSDIDPNHWIGRKVVIVGGKMDGEVGCVVSSGNGWVQLETRTGEIAKRAYNLSLYSVQTESKNKEKQKKSSIRAVESEVPDQQDSSNRRKPPSSASVPSKQVVPAAAVTIAMVSTSRSTRSRDDPAATSTIKQEEEIITKEESGSRINGKAAVTGAVAASRPTTSLEGSNAARVIPTDSITLEKKARNLRDRRSEPGRKEVTVLDNSDAATRKTVADDSNVQADASKTHPNKRSRLSQDLNTSPPHTLHPPKGPSSSRQVHHQEPTAPSAGETTAQASRHPTLASEHEQLIAHHALQNTKNGSKYQQLLLQSRIGSGKVDPAVVEARRNYMNKFVQRQKLKLKSRPHLSDLRHGINASFSNYLGDSSVSLGHSRDSLSAELRCARLLDEHTFCEVCFVQKWPGGKFCWNELCSASPVYWKLTGVTLDELEQVHYQQHRFQQEVVDGDEYEEAEISEALSSSRSKRGSSSSSAANPVSPRSSAEKRQRQGSNNSGEADIKSPRRGSDQNPSVFSFGSSKSPKGKMKAPSLTPRNNLPSFDDMESDVALLSNMDSSNSRRRFFSNVSPRTQGVASDILALRAGRPSGTPAESPGKQMAAASRMESSSFYGNSSFVLPDAEVSNVAAYLLQMPTLVVGQGRSNQDVPYPLRENDCDYENDCLDGDEHDLDAINESNECEEEYYEPSSSAANMQVSDNEEAVEARIC